jgi:hypothetical protein
MSASLSTVLSTDAYAASWFGYGSYVDEARRILYVETPKAACSSIKYLLRRLATDAPLFFNRFLPEVKPAMFIHDRAQMPLPPLTSFSPDRIDEITTGDGWFRFCVIRQPAERFFSAWRDKVFLCKPGFERYLPRDGRRFVEFDEFLHRVVTTEPVTTCDQHWRAQVALLRPDEIDYTHIYDLGALSALATDLAQHLASVDPSARLPAFVRVNEGYAIRPAGFLTSEAIGVLRRFYDMDYRRFGFADLQAADVAPVKAASLVNEFTDAIFDRNRIIAEHVRLATARQ